MKAVLYLSMRFAVASIFVSASTNANCVLPEAPDVDWNMLPGSWYEVFRRRTLGDDSCYNFRDIRMSPGGLYGSFEEIRESESGKTTCSIVPAHFSQSGSTWTLDRKYEYLWDIEADRCPGKQPVRPKLQEVYQFYSQDFVTYTDYDIYILNLMCGSDGKKYIWVHSRNPDISKGEMVHKWECTTLRSFDPISHIILRYIATSDISDIAANPILKSVTDRLRYCDKYRTNK